MADSSLASQVLRSIFFKRAAGKAGRYASNSSRLYKLATQVIKKAKSGSLKTDAAEAKTQLFILVRLVRAYASGEYRKLPWKSLLSVVGVLIYFVSPIDLIPDFLPVIGMADDLALLLWLFKSISGDLEDFNEWEKKTKTIRIG